MTTNPPTDDSELDAIWHQQTFFSPTEYSRRAMRAAFAAGRVSVTPESSDPDEEGDDEEFCDRCFAGVTSDEHHSKCVNTGLAEDGESA